MESLKRLDAKLDRLLFLATSMLFLLIIDCIAKWFFL